MPSAGGHDWHELPGGVSSSSDGWSYCPRCGATRSPVGRVVRLVSANNGTPLPLCEGPNRRVIDGVIVTDYRA
jgi:hypothetical protein